MLQLMTAGLLTLMEACLIRLSTNKQASMAAQLDHERQYLTGRSELGSSPLRVLKLRVLKLWGTCPLLLCNVVQYILETS